MTHMTSRRKNKQTLLPPRHRHRQQLSLGLKLLSYNVYFPPVNWEHSLQWNHKIFHTTMLEKEYSWRRERWEILRRVSEVETQEFICQVNQAAVLWIHGVHEIGLLKVRDLRANSDVPLLTRYLTENERLALLDEAMTNPQEYED